MSVIPPGLYTIQHVLNRDMRLFSYASAYREPGLPVVGSVEISPQFIQQWRISAVDGGDNTYVIEAPGQGLGWAIDRAEPIQTGTPVVTAETPREFRIQHLEEESRGPEEQVYTITIPVNTVGATFYIQQSPTKPAHPPVEVVVIPVIPDAPPAPFWIIRRVLVD